jgi:[acyl-carrier-protein] S-malonyltransferase
MAARSRIALVFPGQGSQKVGMGRAWAEASPAARQTFAEADEALGLPLTRLCWEGPEEELNLTANTQPALLAVSIAIHRALTAAVAPAAAAGRHGGP